VHNVPGMPAPLHGVTVLDLSRVLSGPYCTMLAADMGARVIKIEHPERGDDTRAWGPPFAQGESAYYLGINRNKESVALDFKHPEGRALLERLLARADIVVENFRPGTLDKFALDYRSVSARYPSVIFVSISGFGQNGPRRSEPGYDAVAQAESGMMSVTGEPDRPPVRVGVAIADIAAGMFAFQGLLLALIARGQTGRGQLIDVSLLDAITALLSYQASRYLIAGDVPGRTGNRHATIAPYGAFEATDGMVVIAVGNDAQWRRLCTTLDLHDLASDSRLDTNEGRVVHEAVMHPSLSAALRARAVTDVVTTLRAAGVPCGAVRAVDEALADPQIAARSMIETVAHPTIGALNVLGVPVKLSETPGQVRLPPPRLGEHTQQILEHDLGLDAAAIRALADAGAIRVL
jgi:crotonobetainyl-CoA:carnitine CoA-transferase CaiB-like acyl-CoA transferase